MHVSVYCMNACVHVHGERIFWAMSHLVSLLIRPGPLSPGIIDGIFVGFFGEVDRPKNQLYSNCPKAGSLRCFETAGRLLR